jgi:hypothetical protein
MALAFMGDSRSLLTLLVAGMVPKCFFTCGNVVCDVVQMRAVGGFPNFP